MRATLLLLPLLLVAPGCDDTDTADTADTGAVDAAAERTTIRDQRYCEFLLVFIGDPTARVDVYNTFGLNDCPQAAWDAADTDAIATTFEADTVVRNGPRYWTMDTIAATGGTAAGPAVDLGGLEMRRAASIEFPVAELVARQAGGAYTEITVLRTTAFTFFAGEPIHVLTNAEGTRYVMQAYSQQTDPAQDLASLAALGDRLELPAGWSFAVEVPDADIVVSAGGEAVVVQDELENTYQRE